MDTFNTCAPTAAPCIPAAPQSETRTNPQMQQFACPPGTTGPNPGIDEWRSLTEMRSRSSSCPSPTGPATWGSWSTWSFASATPWVQTANHCTPTDPGCSVPPASATPISRALTPGTQNVPCPAGQSGAHTQSRSITESGVRTTTWACPGPTSSSADTWSGNYIYGGWATTSNTCAASCGPAPANGARTLSCPSGQTGSITQTHTWNASGAPTCWVAAPWATTSNTCTPTPPPATFIAGCDFTSTSYGRTGFSQNSCDWDPHAYWQDWATFQVGDSLDAQGRTVLNTTLYRPEMTSVWFGVNGAASACVHNANYSNVSWDGRSITRIRVYRRSDNVLLFETEIEADFSNL
jgi:hypothetical protein